MNQFWKNMMTLGMAMLVLLAIVTFFRTTPETTNEISYSEFKAKLESGDFVTVHIQDRRYEGDDQGGQSFRAVGPSEARPVGWSMLQKVTPRRASQS